MHNWRVPALILFAAFFGLEIGAPAQKSPAAQPPLLFGAESNYAPFFVGRAQPANPLSRWDAPAASWTALGPLIFRQPLGARPRFDDGAVVARGFRPFYIEKRDASGRLIQFHILYPLFNWRAVKDDGYRWDIATLINHEHGPTKRPTPEHSTDNQFDIWPFYFSNKTGDPATSYRAVFPIYGSVNHRLLQDRMGWFLFPLFGWSERNGTHTDAVLWPIFRRSTGNGVNGWKAWPFIGHETKTDTETGALLYKNSFALLPVYFNNTTWNPGNLAAAPTRALAVFPFYYLESGPGFRSDSYMLFFGRTRRTVPYVYSENRYLWPLFVQGRGPEHRVNRWAPFYTYSRHNAREKTWVAWPLWNHSRVDDGVNIYEKKRLFYFVYNSITQKRIAPPEATPAQKAAIEAQPPAHKVSVWPLFTYWSDGRGRRQLQTLSPFEVFLPQNEPTRLVWTPLFSLYRYEQEAPGHTRQAILWNFITHRHEPGVREFHVGPLYSGERVGEGKQAYKRRALFCGVLGMQKTPDKGWRPFAFRFKTLQQQLAETAGSAEPRLGLNLQATPPATPSLSNQPRPHPQVRQRR